ncbi:MAG: AAA family ATPase [Gemmatimonadetes bacterium]|nr:AAA family ATPase [Gemmatimonadota bacterium]MYE91909.1 AAA family ATPase [Gemmatimonadota bacterium]MYJ12548.1 AAA family ATPase [Gemmatimonadota bacterium]
MMARLATAVSNPRAVPVHVRDLVVGYPQSRSVLGALSLEVAPEEVLAIVGPNGSGKTTLFRTLLGVSWHPSVARSRFPASILGTIAAHAGSAICRKTPRCLMAGVVMESFRWLRPLLSPMPISPTTLRLAGVDYATDVPASKVSKGMKRRLALAIALIRPIRMLILDEPESGLDPGQRHRLRRRIERLRRTMTILVASHDLGELGLMSDRVFSSTKGAASSSSNRAVGSRGVFSNTSSSHWKEPISADSNSSLAS